MLADAEREYGIRSAALRYFNAAGAHPSERIGEAHNPETHLVPLALRVAASLDRSLSVYGTDFATPDGTAIRDYVHVCDLADAHVRAIRYLMDGGASVALNLGTSQRFSVLEMARIVEFVTGRPIQLVMSARRPGDPGVLVADASRATALLDLKCSRSDPLTLSKLLGIGTQTTNHKNTLAAKLDGGPVRPLCGRWTFFQIGQRVRLRDEHGFKLNCSFQKTCFNYLRARRGGYRGGFRPAHRVRRGPPGHIGQW